jgi:RNA polymerase sigma-70 factor, ECF subfamily
MSHLPHEQVRVAIQHLSLDLREIMMLREHAELSYEEIANVLDCSVGTVISLLSAMRSELQALLSAVGPPVAYSAEEGACSEGSE